MIRFSAVAPGYEDLELSTQVLITESLRRGISVEMIDRRSNIVRLHQNGNMQLVRQATKTQADTYISAEILGLKSVCKILLEQAGITVPRGEVYDDPAKAVTDYPLLSSRTLIVKPDSTNFGIGITKVPPASPDIFRQGLELAFSHDTTVIAEDFAEGKEYRFLVINGRTEAILHRIPAHITGNGSNTVEELVAEKNRHPFRGEGYRFPLEKIRIEETERAVMAEQGLMPTDIPAAGQTVWLRRNSNISTGGDSADVTDDFSDGFLRLAERAADVLQSKICGIDIILKDPKAIPAKDNYAVIEANFNPALHMHEFPLTGKPRPVAAAVLNLLGFSKNQ